MKPRCGVGLAAVCASAVRAGIIASSNGSAIAVPMPRKNVLRGRCFLVMNILSGLLFLLHRSDLSGRSRGRNLPHLELRTGGDAHDDIRELVVVLGGIANDLTDSRLIVPI